jgi:hypothetical protein
VHHRRTKIILCGLALIIVAAASFFLPRPVRVIGHLPVRDAEEIQRLVWRDVRQVELPKFEWDSVHYPRYVFNGFTRYARLRILWIEVKDERYVRVVIGISTNTIAADGWDYMVRKNPGGEKWEITGSAYWGIPSVAPADFRIPPNL